MPGRIVPLNEENSGLIKKPVTQTSISPEPLTSVPPTKTASTQQKVSKSSGGKKSLLGALKKRKQK